MFSVLKKVLENKEITQQEADKVSDFIMRRWLTGDNRLIELAATLNCLPGKQNNLSVLRGIAKALKGKIRFIKFPSVPKADYVDEGDILIISKFFRVSKDEGKEYIEWMLMHCPDEFDTIKGIARDLE